MSEDKDRLERWIDEGIERYAKAEPPLGMEARVMAELQQRKPRGWWRPWMIAVPVAALLAVVVGLSLQEKTKPRPVVTPPVATSTPPNAVATSPVAKQVPPERQGRAPALKTKRGDRMVLATAEHAVRPETFPAPAKASEQELLLARLAQSRSAAQTVEASVHEVTQPLVISRIAIDPVRIPLLPGPNPQGE